MEQKDSLIYYLKPSGDIFWLLHGGVRVFQMYASICWWVMGRVVGGEGDVEQAQRLITVRSSAQLAFVTCRSTPGRQLRHTPPASPRRDEARSPQASCLLAPMCVSRHAARAAERERSGRRPCLTWPSHVEGESK